MIEIEPEWLPLARMGAKFEEEMDVRASPSAPPGIRYRHRPIRFSGQPCAEWRRGPAPE